MLTVAAALALPAQASAAFGLLGGINMVAGAPSAAQFQLDSPGQIVRAPDGSHFVLDGNNSKVVKLDANGGFLFSFGGSGTGNDRLLNPSGLALEAGSGDPDLFVSLSQGVIKRFDSDGNYVSQFGGGSGTGNGQFSTLGGIGIDTSCGDLYAVDRGNHRVQRFSAAGTFLETFGSQGSADGQFSFPSNVAFDNSTGHVFVTDSGNRRVQAFDWSGNCASRTHAFDSKFGSNGTSLPDYMENPSGITVDTTTTPHRIYVTTTHVNHQVMLFTGDAGSNPPYTIKGIWGPRDVPVLSMPGSAPGDMFEPSSLVASGGEAWVTERGNNRIQHFTGISDAQPFATPTSAGFWGSNPHQDGYFRSAEAVAADGQGGAYVTDTQKYNIQRFSANGVFLDSFGGYSAAGGPGLFQQQPTDVAVAPNGDVFVSESSSPYVKRFDSTGAYQGTVTWNGAGGNPAAPGALDFDAQGNLWAVDYSGIRVVKVDASGTILTSFGTTGTNSTNDELFSPRDLTVSADGQTVFVLDWNRIKKFTTTDGVTWTPHPASQPSLAFGSGPGEFMQPTAIDLDPITGNLLVTDTGNHRVQRLSATDYSYISQFGTLGLGDSQFLSMRGLAFDEWGNLWVADNGNDRVQRFGDSPTVAITAPTGGTSTDAASIPVSYSSTDPAADCDFVNGASAPLTLGANTITISCENLSGVGTASVSVTRVLPPPLSNPGGGTPPGADPVFTLNLKKKIKPSKRVKFSVVCSAQCKVETSIKIGRKTTKFRTTTLPGSPATKTITVKISKSLLKKINRAAKTKKPAILSAKLKPQTYSAKQGKTGKAKLSR